MTMPAWLEEQPLGSGEVGDDLLQMKGPASWLAEALLSSWQARAGSGSALAASIEAPWGAGKTSFIHLVKRALLSHFSESTAPVWVEFNAWQSSSAELGAWAAIAYRIGEALYKRVHDAALAARERGEKALYIGSPRRRGEMVSMDLAPLADERLHWLDVARIINEEIPDGDWRACMNLFADAPVKVAGRGPAWGRTAAGAARGLLDAGDLIASTLTMGTASAAMALKVLLDAARKGVDAAEKTAASGAEGPSDGSEARRRARRASVGSTWGVDTREFVRQLGELCASLVPQADAWRVVVVIDDVSRVAPEELRGIIDALSYLHELPGALVLVTLDDAALAEVESQLPPYLRRPGERFISKVIQTRYRLPLADPGQLGTMADRMLSEMGLPAAFEAGSLDNPIRRLMEGGVRTPREMKRALAWIWARLASDKALLARCRPPAPGSEMPQILALLADVYLFIEGLIPAEELDDRVRSRHRTLLHFQCQPWDGRSWDDGGKARDPSAMEAELVAWIRCLRLARFAGLKLTPPRLEVAQSVWRRWCLDLSTQGRDPLGLSGLSDASLNDLSQRIGPSSIKTYSVFISLANITKVARLFYLTVESDRVPQTFGEVLDSWHDADALVQSVLSGRAPPAVSAAATMLLHIFHHKVNKEFDPEGVLLHDALTKAVLGGASPIDIERNVKLVAQLVQGAQGDRHEKG